MLPIMHQGLRVMERRRRNLALIRQRLELRTRSNPFELLDERFQELFRLNKVLVRDLIQLLRPHLQDRRSAKGISLEVKVLCALRFYATGSYQRCVGQDFGMALSQTSVHRCVRAVTQALANLSQDLIELPGTQQERNSLKYEFMHRWHFPGTIGAIDGFHVAILKPSEEHIYRNRKGYHSINVQVICDHLLKIRSLYANFGGATHDSYLWRMSDAQRYIARLHNNNENCWFIGDSGYPLQPYLLTPFRNPQTVPEQNYNFAHARARNCVERCIGVLKMRFRCLLKERSARYSAVFMCRIVKACAVLHNLCIDNNLAFEEIAFDEDDDVNARALGALQPQVHPNLGLEKRRNVVHQYFT